MSARFLSFSLLLVLGLFMVGCGGGDRPKVIEGERPAYDESEEIVTNEEVNYNE